MEERPRPGRHATFDLQRALFRASWHVGWATQERSRTSQRRASPNDGIFAEICRDVSWGWLRCRASNGCWINLEVDKNGNAPANGCTGKLVEHPLRWKGACKSRRAHEGEVANGETCRFQNRN